MKQLEYVLSNEKEVLGFLKSQYPMFHLSNVFFRDVHYGILKMFERRGEKVSYPKAEKIAKEFVEKLEKSKVLNKIDQQSWVLNYPEYKKPVVAQAPAAKPAAAAPAAKSPAPAGAKPALPPLGAKPGGAVAAKPALPPLASANPAGAAKPALPPLSSAKPAGAARPPLPPLSSAKPAVAKSAAPSEAPPESAVQAVRATPVVEAPKVESPKSSAAEAAPAATPSGQKKSLPPLKGNYTPASKK